MPQEKSSTVYSGDVEYKASNGWTIVVFNDANSWDYINSIRTNDCRIVSFDELDEIESLRNYHPPLEVVRSVYLIPEISEDI